MRLAIGATVWFWSLSSVGRAGYESVTRAAMAAPRALELQESSLAEKDPVESERLLRSALALAPDSDLLSYDLACVLAKAGRTEEAVSALLTALDHGWRNLEWLRADEDLTAIVSLPRVAARVAELELDSAVPWPTPATPVEPDPLRADELARGWQEAIDGSAGVMSPWRLQTEWRELKAWRAASWDATAASSAAPRLDRWRAIHGLVGDEAEAPAMFDRAALEEARRRIRDWQAAQPSVGEQGEDLTARVLFAGALVENALGILTNPANDAHVADKLVRDLALLAIRFPTGPVAEDALLQLVGALRDDLPAAAAVQARLLEVSAEPTKMRRRLMAHAAARGVYWRLATLPKFQTVDTDGKPFSPADFPKSALLITFWATWCGSCQNELSTLRKITAEKDVELQVVGVSLDTMDALTPAQFKEWCSENGVTWRQIRDAAQAAPLADLFGVTAVPFNLLLVDGVVKATTTELDGPDGRLSRLEEQLSVISPRRTSP